MHRGLVFPIFAAILLLAAGATYLGIAADARRRPLDGLWRASFFVDSSTRPETRMRQRVEGRLELQAGAPPYPWARVFWQRTFVGQFEIPFVPMLGIALPVASPPAFAVRRGRDPVELFLGQPCCDAGGLRALGVVRGDTVAGDWGLDLNGDLVRGSFRLERGAGPRERTSNVALQQTIALR